MPRPTRTLDKVRIGHNHQCFIVAEIGQNHQGDLDQAKELIRLAKNCGVNCVKFQKSALSHRFTSKALQSPYESPHAFGPTYGEHRVSLEFSEEYFVHLKDYAEKEVGIVFAASAMDIPSADFLMSLDLPFIKIGSGDANNFLLIKHIAEKRYPIVLSTGMQSLTTVCQAHDLITEYSQELAVLHCISAYPTPLDDVNLRILSFYQQKFPQTVIGYSGHETGISVALAAVALGAKIIERHFTKDKSKKGTDHKCSLDPAEMTSMVNGIRDIERALGQPKKTLLPSEVPCYRKLGKSIVTTQFIPAGTRLSMPHLTIKVSRPMGASPEHIFDVIGFIAQEDIAEDTPIETNETGEVFAAKAN